MAFRLEESSQGPSELVLSNGKVRTTDSRCGGGETAEGSALLFASTPPYFLGQGKGGRRTQGVPSTRRHDDVDDDRQLVG